MKLSYTMFDIENLIAKDLLDIGAVLFRPHDPFTFTSGRISPIYVDVRRLYGVSAIRSRLTAACASYIYKHISREGFSVVAGGETAGIPLATLIADRMHTDFCYIRKAPKGFGRGVQIESLSEEELQEGRKFLLAEDLCSDGGSKLNFIKAIRQSGNIITDIFTVFSYGIFGAEALLADDGITLHSLVNAAKLVEVAEDLQAFPPEVLSLIRNFIATGAITSTEPLMIEPVPTWDPMPSSYDETVELAMHRLSDTDAPTAS